MSNKPEQQQRPYYKPQPPKQEPQPANVTPVNRWTIAAVLFWGRDENGKPKKPNQ